MNSKFRLLPSLAVCFALPLSALAAPLTTAFNYQGRLDRNGAPATGVFDLKFELYTEATGGTLVVPAIELPNQGVSGGLVSADLNFGGATVFDGRAFWLQISARAQGSPTYILLPERTPIRPTPYSIHALNAATVKDGGVTSSSLAAGAVTSAKLATGAVGLAQLNAGAPPQPNALLMYNGTGLGWQLPQALGQWGVTSANDGVFHMGKVGIGTNLPASKLNVFATGYGIEQTDGTVTMGVFTSAGQDAAFIGTRSNHKLHLEVNGSPRMTIATNGNVGIGTSTPANKLTVFATGYGFEQTDGTVRLGTYTSAGTAAGFIGTQSDHKLHLEVAGSPRMTIGTNGNIGIGTSTPAHKLHVAGTVAAPAVLATHGIIIGNNPGTNDAPIYSDNAASTRVVLWNSATNGLMDLHCKKGDVSTLTIRGGADLAEPFAMSHQGVEPGTVVVIDAANPGKLKTSTRAYDKKVAGIVSGANGIQPGISMIQEDKLEGGENVALSGRVYVKADTSAGSIEPGDLLTTSSTAGHAMKATDHSRAQGAIIGKAMTPLADGDGMVLVLVTLQ